jgi:hypothetical protein
LTQILDEVVMLSHEWRELEVLCERISDLRHRYAAAQRTKNSGLVEGLKEDIRRTRRQREMLVQHISARLGSVAADHRSDTVEHEDKPEPVHVAEPEDDIEADLYSTSMVGFPNE